MSQPRNMNKKSKQRLPEEAQEVRVEEEPEQQFGIIDQQIRGDNLEEHEAEDYQEIEQLDKYDSREFDEQEYSQMSLGQKRRAEEEIKLRENKQKGGKRNVPQIMLKTEHDSTFSHGQVSSELQKRRENYYEGFTDYYENREDLNDERYQRLDDIRGKLSEWIKEQRTIRYIKGSFNLFLANFKDETGKLIYQEKIHKMCNENKQSIEIDYTQLSDKFPTIAYWIFESPSLIFPFLNQVVLDLACKLYPGYETFQEEVFVKIDSFPLIEKIRDLRTFHINTLVKVRGVITKKYPIYQKLKKLYYICVKCSDRKGPIYQNDEVDIKLGHCPNCQSRGPYKISEEERVYGNNQKIVVQESPSLVPPGRVPRSKDVILLGDNIDMARPGDEVEVVGIYTSIFDYQMNTKHNFPIFKTFIEGNFIKETKQIENTNISEQDKKEILNLSKNPNVFDIIYQSIAPSIYGHEEIKKAIALALFGGVPVQKEQHTIRGDINILLVGDAGLGKSQFLKYIQNVSPRSIYTTGKGASAVGLTASVKKDPQSQEWCLEGGALVLADSGICLIDEFDKMNEADRTSIHEAMEQQSISISKAGIVATLKARCSVIAAANPSQGQYNEQKSFKENVELSEPILSRFDILLVLRDNFDIIRDEKLANFLIDSHIKNHPNAEEENEIKIEEEGENREGEERQIERNQQKNELDQLFLKKYILYAKKNFNNPKLDPKSSQKLEDFYVELRAESKKTSGLNIVVRHLESLIRMTQASAKIHLRKVTNQKDCDIAISILLNSFIQSQKPSIVLNLKKKFSHYIQKSTSISAKISHLLNLLINRQLMYNQFTNKNLDDVKLVKIRLEDLKKIAEENQISNIKDFIESDYFRENFQLIKEKINDMEIEFILKLM